MLRFLYPLGSPKLFYKWVEQWRAWILWGALVLLSAGWLWGLFIAPMDYQQGDAFRLIYVHVPAAFLSMLLYAAMGGCAILLLVWRIKLAGVLLQACAVVGASITLLALITGSLWGRPMWGTWWIWDARLTSELILLFLYGAVLAIAQAYASRPQGDQLLAWLTLIGLIDLPIIHYSVYWWNTLHQGATLSFFTASTIDRRMAYPLYLSLIGFALLGLFLVLRYAQNAVLIRERHQTWVLRVC